MACAKNKRKRADENTDENRWAGAGELDLSGLTVETGPSMPASFDLAVTVPVTEGGTSGVFTGLPDVKASSRKRAKLCDGGTRCRIINPGLDIVIR